MGGVGLSVDVLGPIRARDEAGRDVTPDGSLQRRLLAMLVLHRGRTVSSDAAVEAMWPDEPPRAPAAALQTHLSRLRRSLPAYLIESVGTGYRLAADRVVVDTDVLADLLAAPPGPEVADRLGELLERWRGPAYPELVDVDDGRVEAARLEELRTQAVERRAEVALSGGTSDQIVAELTRLAEEHPLRERPRELLMAALAASGRTADALRTYDDFRRALGDELGIEPSPSLTALQATLLRASGPPPADDLPTTPAWSLPHRLPAAVTSLLGRDELLARIEALVAEHRLVTLLGFGGVGKTRLALELGRRLQAARSDRAVVFVELAAATEESAVEATAAALAIEGRPGVGLTDRLATVLADTEVVLVLDNCEHVLDPIARLAELLLAQCPHVTMVATSRERLRVPGEQLLPVPPLPLDDPHDDPAVELFVERGRAVSPDFDPGPRDLDRIRGIVRRLDGLPLAIELAAARLHILDVDEVAAGLDRRFRLLSGGARTNARHESLSAAVAWSVGLLPPELSSVFAALAVFAGSFDLHDATEIAGIDADDAAAALDQLSERSLVMRSSGHRYVLLETLRAYGAELLAREGRDVEVRGRHAAHAIAQAEAVDRSLGGPTAERALFELDAALPELRTALAWLVGDEDGPRDVLEARRLIAAVYDAAYLRLRPDVLAWSERVLAADPTDDGPLAAETWAVAALASWIAGDLQELGRRGTRAAEVAERGGGDPTGIVTTIAGSWALFEGRLDDAVAAYQRAQAIAADDLPQRLTALGTELLALAYAGDARAAEVAAALLAEVGDARGPHAAWGWYCAGESDLVVDPDRARTRLDTAVELAESSGATFIAGIAGTSRASIEARVGDPADAAARYRRLLAQWRRAGMWATQWTMLRSVAALLERLGHTEQAAVLVGAVLATEEGHRIFGDDEVTLAQLVERLRAEMGPDEFDQAFARGGVLDGPSAVEHALAALS